MKAKLLILALLIFIVFTFTGCDGFVAENNDSLVNVIMLNDNHGILGEDVGGIDRIASGIKEYASQGHVVKIANGDMFQGTYVSSTLHGLPMLDALNALDFDAFVIGNHEFDWGLDEIKKYKDGDATNGEAEFPFLGANIYDKRTGEMVDWLEPYVIVTFGEIKIGVIGIIGEVESSILSAHLENYEFVDAENIVKDLANELREQKDCDAVIVAAHGDDYDLNTTFVSFDEASRIDGIFNGHTHTSTDEVLYRSDGSGVCVLQNGGYGDSFATLTLEFDKNGVLKDTDGRLNYTDLYDSEGILSDVFKKYEEHIAKGEQVLFTSDEYIDRYDVGINVAHSMYLKYDTDFAVINSGGIRAAINPGEVTFAEVFQILPFENEVYIVTLTGGELKSYLNNAGSIYYWGIGINAVLDSGNYTLAIVDFVYLGYTFDNYRKDSYIDTNDTVRDVFIEYILENTR